MAATVQQHCTTNGNTKSNRTNNTATTPNPQLKRLVYSKYRELLGSYNGQANAYIETLPSYMVQKDNGFNLEIKNSDLIINSTSQNEITTISNQNEMYGAGQRMPAQQTYEAPACVQNAMMTKDKKPFTYTPGGIDLSQIKSERMAKRLARNAQAEGATGIQQQNRSTQPQSPGGSSPNAVSSMGAAAMGMPFQVLPPPPPPSPGKNFNGGSAPAPPPPPQSSSNFSNTGTLAPPTNGNGAVGRGSAPNSPNMPRKSPTPQRFEPPPMGFRPEIKIPPNPMAALRKVPPPVEKNTFWKDEYVKERSKSPMVDVSNTASCNNSVQNNGVNSASSSSQMTNAYNNGTAILSNDNIDGVKKTMPATTINNAMQGNQANNNYTNYQQPQQQQQQHTYTPPTPPQQPQHSPIKNMQQTPHYGGFQTNSTPQHNSQQSPQQQQQSAKPEFRSVAAPTSPAVSVYTKQSGSPRTVESATPPRATESPFKFAQQQQQQRAPPPVSSLAMQSTPSSASSGASVSPNNQAQSVPWRTQRGQSQQPQPSVVAQSHPQPIYNNVQQQPQRNPDLNTQQPSYQGPKPTNVGSLYIAPLAPPTEPQAQHIVRQQMQQQQQRESPMRQMAPQQQPPANQQLRWMSTQPTAKEQPAWARPEENGNVVPSSLNRIKSPAPPSTPSAQAQQPQQHIYQQPLNQGNGFVPQNVSHNFGAQPINATGLRLQINTPVNNQSNSQNGPKERIIPIQLEQTPTYNAAQPSFNQQQQYGTGSIPPAPGYVMRTPNQFVDQGYNNFGQQQQQQQPQPQRVMSPNVQQLNAPRMVQQTQNNIATGQKTHIIPIAIENNEGRGGPVSKTPIVIQNDQRTPPVQSKSFRILQKITDTIDDGTNDDNANQQQQQLQQQPVEPQLQRPTFARQMSAQQARHSPSVEQMRRMQIGHEQGNYSAPTTPSAIKYTQQRSFYDNSQQYIPPSEQQVPEPKKYTGSAIPSRSFKILQAMTQPENADKQENCPKHNEMNEIESKPDNNRYFSYTSNSSAVEPLSSSSSNSINSELAFSSSSSPSPTPSQPLLYPSYPYPYVYPWYPPPPPPPPLMSSNQNGEICSPPNWHYPYGMASATPTPTVSAAGELLTHYPPYPYYYPYYPPPAHMPPHSSSQNHRDNNAQPTEFDLQKAYPSYMPPPHLYFTYPYHKAANHSSGSDTTRAGSVLPDIIITPSSDDAPSKFTMQHQNKPEKELAKRASSIEAADFNSLKLKPSVDGSVVDIFTQQLENITKCIKNNLNSKCQAKISNKKNIDQKSPEENMLPESEREKLSDEETSDSEITPKQTDKKGLMPLKSIKSVNNIQIYNGQKLHEIEADLTSESESEDDNDDEDETTADGESDIFDEEDEEEANHNDFEEESDSEEFLVDDSLSVIYEEESEMEKSSIMAKTDKRRYELSADKNYPPDQLQLKKELNADDDEKDLDSTSVTVRLPLKFSFSTSKDAEKITTVEVGKSHIEERKSINSLSEKRNSFHVASVESDSETDECDVSVTISLAHSSRSSSVDGKVENANLDNLYPIEDMPLPEEALEKIESSQEDISVSVSLNTHNKCGNDTNNYDIINNIDKTNDSETGNKIQESKKPTDVPEEMDFFATLMATKIQAQKIKEQSASYWGKSPENMEEKMASESEIKKLPQEECQKDTEKLENNVKNKKNKLNSRKKRSKILDDISVRKADEIKNHPQKISSCNKIETSSKEAKDNCPKIQEKNKKTKFSFWDRCSKTDKDSEAEALEQQSKAEKDKPTVQSTKQSKDDKATLSYSKSTEEKRNTKSHETKCKESEDQSFVSKENQNSAINHETEEIADIWADRVEDLPPIKPIKSKLMSLETASNSFWSSVTETEKQNDKLKKPLQPETVTKVEINMNVLRSTIMEVSQPQTACVLYEEEKPTEPLVPQGDDAEHLDFWTQIENSRKYKTPERHANAKDELTLIHSFGEQETSMYSDDDRPTTPQEFDPLKYPEEPREVDTDEEIDFWAEIEAKRQAEEDDVTFHKSASFWASKERQNSVDETPYKPVLPKAFHAKLPSESPSENINIWEALEAHKGEEPLIIDPEMEEEKILVQEYDRITKQDLAKEDHSADTVSDHEAIRETPLCLQAQVNQEEPYDDFGVNEEHKQDTLKDVKNSNSTSKPEPDELEVKRSNYRKAMAFFTTSIDEHKERSADRYERSKMNRTSYIEEETEQWDWDAVNEALQQENSAESNKISTENDEQETFVKEQTPKATLSADINNKEKTPLPEVFVEPSVKHICNEFSSLDVNKLNEDRKISVKDRISAFETGAVEKPGTESRRESIKKQSLSVESSTRQSSLSRNSSTQRSESEMDEDDSGVTDMNKQLSETDTESESFPELRKMSSYQRASTHSRLFKLLQEDLEVADNNLTTDEFQFKPSRKKIVHNVSITRKQNPSALAEAETMSQRRERLSLPLYKNTSIDNDNPSTPNSPASPIMGHTANKCSVVSDKLVSELVQSLLLKSDSTHFRNLPMEKLQAAAKRVLEEELDSLENSKLDSTPAPATNETATKNKSYAEYYNTWSEASGAENIVPSKSFRALQDSRRSPWTARCPRVLSSKTINRDLTRVTESPEISANNNNKSTETLRQFRETSIGRWKKS